MEGKRLWMCNACGEDFFSNEEVPECPYCYEMDCETCEVDEDE
mgnify:CR=1 FL=1